VVQVQVVVEIHQVEQVVDYQHRLTQALEAVAVVAELLETVLVALVVQES
jgi:hypothetical protein